MFTGVSVQAEAQSERDMDELVMSSPGKSNPLLTTYPLVVFSDCSNERMRKRRGRKKKKKETNKLNRSLCIDSLG